jgi:long-chain acyl-CoA synthetase
MHGGPTARDGTLDAKARDVSPEDLATIIYTSGTTGISKGVMLTHRNLASNIEYSLKGFDLGDDEVSVSFLPLSHVTARHVDFALLYNGVTLAYCPFLDQLPKTLLEVRPSMFVAVPRVYEKIHTQADLKAKGFPKNMIFRWALSVGRAEREKTLAGITPGM